MNKLLYDKKCNKIKELHRKILPWIICVDPKCNQMFPYKRNREISNIS